ncbi:hypothetical protein [Pseudomonas sp. Leaf127]|uniref:hypothetical protein n=1 Tax=Pseudomonas sp. Leaf127 TaxID=1736267 RepID=UPI000B099E17|nr:hypothetical protein [Pseudomonas sp. Leaf127]
MQTFRIPTPAEMAAKKAGAAQVQPAKSQEDTKPVFKGYTNCPDKMAVYHLPKGL